MKSPRQSLLSLSAAILATVALHSSAIAVTVGDYNFDNLANGSTPPTTTPGVDTLPQHTIYSTGGFPDAGPVTGTVTIEDVGSLHKAAVMATTQGGIGSLFMDTQFLSAGKFASISFDLNVIDIPAFGLPQVALGAENGQAFALQAFGLDSQRVLRFAVSPTSETTGTFGIRLPGAAGDLYTVGTYTEGETHHFDFLINFETSLAQIYVDSSLAYNSTLVNPGTGLSEVFIFQNGVEGKDNKVAIDNIVVTTSVPDGGSNLLMLGMAMGGIVLFRKRLTDATAA